VCVFAAGDAGDQAQVLIGPCSIPPLEAVDHGLRPVIVPVTVRWVETAECPFSRKGALWLSAPREN
jgi:hypothetical protein